MKSTTIQRLNTINRDFYKNISQEFSDSRNYFWEGWEKILPLLKKPPETILDVGCGNGRFADFLIKKNFSDFFYCGIDNNDQLLKIAKEKLAQKKNHTDFSKIDIVFDLLQNTFKKNIQKKNFDLVVLFGVIHHIPSYTLRKQLLQDLIDSLSTHGTLVVTFWQFKNDERFQNKNIDIQKFQLRENDLERNDFILDWQRGKEAFRYFHHADDVEQKKLFSELAGAKLIDEFYADGKTDDLNKYLILQKI